MAALQKFATDDDAKNAKAVGKPLVLRYGQGLYLVVTPAGTKSWRYDYTLNGHQSKVLGWFPATGLDEARAARDAVRKILHDGGDPKAERKIEIAYERWERAERLKAKIIAAEGAERQVTDLRRLIAGDKELIRAFNAWRPVRKRATGNDLTFIAAFSGWRNTR